MVELVLVISNMQDRRNLQEKSLEEQRKNKTHKKEISKRDED